jgi:hypothetical protein
MDQLSGFATEVTTPYNNSFRDLIVSSTKDLNQQTDMMGKVSYLLNNGNTIGAMKTVESLALNKAKMDDPDNYMGTATAKKYIEKTERIRQILKEAGIVDTVGGPVEGTFQKILGRFKGKEATKLKAEITTLYADFRKELLGSAVTPSEAKFLEPLFADITDKKGNFMEKINAFDRNVLDKYNSTRSSVNLPIVSQVDLISDIRRLKLYEELQEKEQTQPNIVKGDDGLDYEIID